MNSDAFTTDELQLLRSIISTEIDYIIRNTDDLYTDTIPDDDLLLVIGDLETRRRTLGRMLDKVSDQMRALRKVQGAPEASEL